MNLKEINQNSRSRSGKILIGIFFVTLGMTQNSTSQDFYDIETVNTIELLFVEANWDEILDSLCLAGNEERLVGTAIINGVQFDSVGVRYKGNSSYNPNQVKNPLNIKLDYIIEDQLLDDYGTLKLANCFKDPSFVREAVGYEIARKYMAACQSNFANVYINGDLIGLYSSVQDVDKFFMRNHFYSDENARFKGKMLGPPSPSVVWGYLGPDSTSYYNYYTLESQYGWSDLIGFLDTLSNHTSDLEEVLDVDNHLWMLAFDILMVNLDAPVNMPQNYYLYKDDAAQFNPILWDLNENFGAFSILVGGPPLNISQMQQLDPFFNISNPNYPIINRVLPDPTYQKMYIAHMKTIIEENFSNGWFLDRVLEIQDIIDADVQADPNKLYTYLDFLNNVYSQVGFGPMSIVGLTQLMDPRVTFLNNHYAFQGIPPIISEISYTPSAVPPNSTVWFSATVDDADLVELGCRQSLGGRFYKLQMFDDGNHHDGLAGDGIYGISVEAGLNNMDYYVYAENDEAAAFSPSGAEYEFYTVSIDFDLAINEFMADNETTIADPQGEYDDWLEIYNGCVDTVYLFGMYLTDDLSEPGKWAFPDTSIEPSGFMLVWTDDDEGDPGLHTNFRLSADGEEIGLFVDQGGTLALIDSVTFGPQNEDISYGRYPDGAPNWYQMNPTPEAPNISSSLPDLLIELTYLSGSPVPAGGGNLYFNVYVENQDVIPLDFDAWLDVEYEGGPPTTVVLRSLTDYQPGWTINRPNMYFPVPGSYAAGNYDFWGRVGNHPAEIWDESGFSFVKLGTNYTEGFIPRVPDGVPDPFNEIIKGEASDVSLPSEFALHTAYPNPFNQTTNIRFDLPEECWVKLEVFDITGRSVRAQHAAPLQQPVINGWRNAGRHEVTFDASGLASGLYFYRLNAGDFTASGKMVLMK